MKGEGTAVGKHLFSREKANTWPGGERGMTMMIVYGTSITISTIVRRSSSWSFEIRPRWRTTRFCSMVPTSLMSPKRILKPRKVKSRAARRLSQA